MPQEVETPGLAAVQANSRKYTILPLRITNDAQSAALAALSTGRTAEEAHHSHPQTNMPFTTTEESERQRAALVALNDVAKQALAVNKKRESALQQLARAIVAEDADALTAALEEAAAAELAPANLQMGRLLLAEIQASVSDLQHVAQDAGLDRQLGLGLDRQLGQDMASDSGQFVSDSDAFARVQLAASEAFDRAQNSAREAFERAQQAAREAFERDQHTYLQEFERSVQLAARQGSEVKLRRRRSVSIDIGVRNTLYGRSHSTLLGRMDSTDFEILSEVNRKFLQPPCIDEQEVTELP